jgi:hypothetical protein
MTSRITVFNHFLERLVEFDYPSTPRSWVLNGYGKAEFSLSTLDSKCLERYLQYGNFVHIEHIPTKDEFNVTNGTLPHWTGILLPPRNWSLGVLGVSAYSAESILKFRSMPYMSIKGTADQNFKFIVNLSYFKAQFIPIFFGSIATDENIYPDELRTNAYDHLQKLMKDSLMEWNITGDIINNKLFLVANLYIRQGFDTRYPLNNLNSELSGALMTEQGTPSNHVFGYSQAYTQQSRQARESINLDSFNEYGPLEINQVFVGKKDGKSVYISAQKRAEERGRPVKIVPRNVLDFNQSFSYLDIGNSVIITDNNAGFNYTGGLGYSGEARITTMSYNDLSNKVQLNLEVE